ASDILKVLETIDDILGLRLVTQTPDISDEQKALIGARIAARTAKEWAESDRLRDMLADQGIALRDLPHGAIWHRL
ncbi:MAG TPA: hypothetical protein VK983_05405, partial [Candidatus Limnocylindrales bacterium]|nr:hypothetical protein [Candidatus Limnocylindrales bacterium]